MLLDRDMKKKDLQEAAGLSGYAMLKLGRDENVTTEVLGKICGVLNLTISLKEMLVTKPKLKLLIPLLAFALVYNIGVYFLDSDGFRLEMKVYDFIVTVLTVGFFEEIVFRGWFQNAISRFTGDRIDPQLIAANDTSLFIAGAANIISINKIDIKKEQNPTTEDRCFKKLRPRSVRNIAIINIIKATP